MSDKLIEIATKAILFADCGNTEDWKDNRYLGEEVIKSLKEEMQKQQSEPFSAFLFKYPDHPSPTQSDKEAVRNAALEDAAKSCEQESLGDHTEHPCDIAYNNAIIHAAQAIRALKSQPAQPSDTEIAESFQEAIDAYQDPNQSWGISREYAIATVRSIKAAMQADREGS